MTEQQHWHASDALALPRCPETSLRLPIGAWEFRTETDPAAIRALLAQGWRVVGDDGPCKLLKYTHWERIT